MTEPENTTPVEPTDPVEEAPTEEPAKESKGNGADAPAKALPKVMKLKLSELQMYKLAAHEERHERFKAEMMEQLQRKYATQLAKEYAVLLNSSPNVVNSGKSLDATVNQQRRSSLQGSVVSACSSMMRHGVRAEAGNRRAAR
jgi:hypothetical protein